MSHVCFECVHIWNRHHHTHTTHSMRSILLLIERERKRVNFTIQCVFVSLFLAVFFSIHCSSLVICVMLSCYIRLIFLFFIISSVLIHLSLCVYALFCLGSSQLVQYFLARFSLSSVFLIHNTNDCVFITDTQYVKEFYYMNAQCS